MSTASAQNCYCSSEMYCKGREKSFLETYQYLYYLNDWKVEPSRPGKARLYTQTEGIEFGWVSDSKCLL